MSGNYPSSVTDTDFNMPQENRWRCAQVGFDDMECHESLPPLEGADGQGVPGPCPKCSFQSYPAQCFRCGRGTAREVGGFYNTINGGKVWTCTTCQLDDQRKGTEDSTEELTSTDATDGDF